MAWPLMHKEAAVRVARARARQVALAADASRFAHGSERRQHHQWEILPAGVARPLAGVLKQGLPVQKRIESLHQPLAPHPCGGWWDSSVGASKRRR